VNYYTAVELFSAGFVCFVCRLGPRLLFLLACFLAVGFLTFIVHDRWE
jgi:hypothetical protein